MQPRFRSDKRRKEEARKKKQEEKRNKRLHKKDLAALPNPESSGTPTDLVPQAPPLNF
jgi:hypothetical protein